MKTTIFQAYILASLAVLGICAPAPAADGLLTPASPPIAASGVKAEDVHLPETPAGITVKLVPASEAGNNTGAVTPRDLAVRQQSYDVICLGTLANTANTVTTINYIEALNEVITIPASTCYYWETVSSVVYFCSTACGGISFGTTWLAGIIVPVYNDCVPEGLSGEAYAYYEPFWEAGIELGGPIVPLYAPTFLC